LEDEYGAITMMDGRGDVDLPGEKPRSAGLRAVVATLMAAGEAK
jgi:hypothetical protein